MDARNMQNNLAVNTHLHTVASCWISSPTITIHGTTNIKFICFEFSLQLLYETFLILKRNERYDKKMYIGLHANYPLFLSYFTETWIFSKVFFFRENLQISNLKKIRPVEAELFHADRRTDSRTDMTTLLVALRNFANAPKKPSWRLNTALWLFYVGVKKCRLISEAWCRLQSPEILSQRKSRQATVFISLCFILINVT